jgi:hypothetical protein
MPQYPHDQHTSACVHCSTPLGGRQERYCSAACRQAVYRAGKRGGHPALRVCELCGGTFEPVRPRQRYCTYDIAGFDDEAGGECESKQAELLEIADYWKEARATAVCAHCGEPVGWAGRGRPRKYCSGRCKVAAFRAAVAAAQERTAEPL